VVPKGSENSNLVHTVGRFKNDSCRVIKSQIVDTSLGNITKSRIRGKPSKLHRNHEETTKKRCKSKEF